MTYFCGHCTDYKALPNLWISWTSLKLLPLALHRIKCYNWTPASSIQSTIHKSGLSKWLLQVPVLQQIMPVPVLLRTALLHNSTILSIFLYDLVQVSLRNVMVSIRFVLVPIWIDCEMALKPLHFIHTVKGFLLCNVSAATRPCIQKSTFNQSEFV